MERHLIAIAAFTSQASYKKFGKALLEERPGIGCGGRIAIPSCNNRESLGNGESNNRHGEKKAKKPYATNPCCTSGAAFAKPQQSRHGLAGIQSKLCGT